MDLMGLRRGLLMSMAEVLPSYLKHIKYIPSENTGTATFNVGTDIHNAVIISNFDIDNPSVNTLINGLINIVSGSFYGSCTRIVTRKPNGSIDYYGPGSSNQSWSFTDGVLTLSATNWFFGNGVRYDIFYW